MIAGTPASRIDERDTMFARMARRPGTPAYEDYYGRNPERRAADDHLRAMPPLLEPGGRHYDAAVCQQARRHFEAIDAFVPDGRDIAAWAPRLSAARDLGAVPRGHTPPGAVAALDGAGVRLGGRCGVRETMERT